MNKVAESTINYIFSEFPVTTEEYNLLEEKLGKLVEYISWKLYKRNSKNCHTDEQVDISQGIRCSLIKAGCYYKRQVYIEDCLTALKKCAKNKMSRKLVEDLTYLWDNKTKHGASKQKFGKVQEKILNKLIKKIVPKSDRPDKAAALKIDTKFMIYCKAILWNEGKAMGKKITKEKVLRCNAVSLSEFDYLSPQF